MTARCRDYHDTTTEERLQARPLAHARQLLGGSVSGARRQRTLTYLYSHAVAVAKVVLMV